MDKYIEELIKSTDLFGKVNTKIAKLPNPYILTYILETIDTISSNDIENIFTTVDEAYGGLIESKNTPFSNYKEALKNAHKSLIANTLILNRDIKQINKKIRGVDGEYRKVPVSITDSNNKVIHKPIDSNLIPEEMSKLIELINGEHKKNQILNALDIHHKFEYIHPFSDGNGRTGRILFALLLAKYEILDVPVSIFSYSIMKSKKTYYKALRYADEGDMKQYYYHMLYMLNESLLLTIEFIDQIAKKMSLFLYDNEKKRELAKYLFSGVKTSNRYLVKKTGYNNKTISKYVLELVEEGLISIERSNKYVSYRNVVLESIIKDTFKQIK